MELMDHFSFPILDQNQTLKKKRNLQKVTTTKRFMVYTIQLVPDKLHPI